MKSRCFFHILRLPFFASLAMLWACGVDGIGLNNTTTPPAVSANFLSGQIPSSLTFSRSTSATYFDASGVLQTATANTPRFGYDFSTHTLLGLMIEPATTQLISNSSATATSSSVLPNGGWIVSYPGGTTVTYNVHSDANFAGYNDFDIHIVGGSTGYNGSVQIFPAGYSGTAISASTVYTFSVYTQILAGNTASMHMDLDFNDDSGATANVDMDYPASLTRYQTTLKTGSTASTAYLWLQFDGLRAYADLTIRVLAAQLETGAHASSPILTSTGSATRSADSLSYSYPNRFFDPTQSTVQLKTYWDALPATVGTVNPGLISFSDGSNHGADVSLNVATGKLSSSVTQNGIANSVATSTLAISAQSAQNFAASLGSGDFNFAFAGAAVDGSSGITSTSLKTLTIGSNALVSGSEVGGYLQSFQYLPHASSDTTLNTLSQ